MGEMLRIVESPSSGLSPEDVRAARTRALVITLARHTSTKQRVATIF